MLDFSKSTFSFNKSIWNYTKVQHMYSSLIRNSHFQLKRLPQDLKYLNIGCGPNISEKFINMDYYWHDRIDLCWDVTKPLPFKSNSLTGIFTEHCLEHVTFQQCSDALRECHRVLQPGGVLRVILPDAGKYIELYHQAVHGGDDVRFPYPDEDDKEYFTPIMAVNRIFRNFGHQFAYDIETIEQMLIRAGFIAVNRVEFMKGSDRTLLIDTESRKTESLYIEGIA